MTWTTRRNPYTMACATYQLFALVRCAMAVADQTAREATIFGGMAIVLAMVIAVPLGRRAMARGYGWTWGGLAVLGLAGFVVVYCLPDRTARPVRGFPIEPRRP